MVKIIIKSKNGLHARPASMVVKEAANFAGDVVLSKGDKEANGKSIMKVMGLGLQMGDELTIEAKGEGAEELEKRLLEIIEKVEE